jgi:hypothetical protein
VVKWAAITRANMAFLFNNYEAIAKKNDQMYALIAICVALHPTRLDDTIHYGVIQTGGVESDTDGNQGVHLVVLLGDGFVVVAGPCSPA